MKYSLIKWINNDIQKNLLFMYYQSIHFNIKESTNNNQKNNQIYLSSYNISKNNINVIKWN